MWKNDFFTCSIISAWQTYNALFAVRCILKYLIETVGEEQMLKHIEAPQTTATNEAMSSYRLEVFFEALIELITDVPLWWVKATTYLHVTFIATRTCVCISISAFVYSEFTYVVHLEAINCLLVLLSVQLFSQTAAEYSAVYRIAMHAHSSSCSQHAPAVVCTLLHNFIQQEHAPPGLLTQQPGGGIVFSIAGKYTTMWYRARVTFEVCLNAKFAVLAGLWNVIRMGIGSGLKNVQIAHNGAAEDEEKKRDTETPLASQSLLLLLVLTNHCTAMQNPYRNALFSFIDMQGAYRTNWLVTPVPRDADRWEILFANVETLCRL